MIIKENRKDFDIESNWAWLASGSLRVEDLDLDSMS